MGIFLDGTLRPHLHLVSKCDKGQRSGGYLVPERTVLLVEGVDLLAQPALCGGPATLPPPQLLLQGA